MTLSVLVLLNRLTKHVAVPCFPTKTEVVDVQDSEISKKIICRKCVGSSLNYFEHLYRLKVQNNWFGESWSRPLGPQTMKMKGFRAFPK